MHRAAPELCASGVSLPYEINHVVQHDISAVRREYAFRVSWLEKLLAGHLYDQRDLVVLRLLLNVLVVSLPSALGVFLFHSHLLGLCHLILNYALLLQRFLVALLHVTEHRRLFRSGKLSLFSTNLAAPLILAPLFGIPSGLYKLHHRVMHHVEGNRHPQDTSSTEQYQRDHLPHFIWYWARHVLAAWVEVPMYALKIGRISLLAECLAMEASYMLAVCLLWHFNSVATLWVFVVPYLLSSLALMFGNWSQHIFLRGDLLHSPYGITYNCIANKDNQYSFNDGYHIQHHMNSQLHWSELPERFLSTVAEHGRHEALVFQDIGVFDVGMMVFTGRLEKLASKLVPCDERMAGMSQEQRVQMLKERLRPISRC